MLAASQTLRPASAGPSPTRRTLVKCAGCAAAFGPQDWQALPLLGTLADDAINAHVVRWPPGVRIEIRRCERCARPIARLARFPWR